MLSGSGRLSKCRRGGECSPNPCVSLETVQHWHVLCRKQSGLWHWGSEEAKQHFLCMDLLPGGGKRSLGEVPLLAEVSLLLSGPAQIFSQRLTQSGAYATQLPLAFKKSLFCLVHIWAWVLRCQGVHACPRWSENSFEEAQFCSEMAHAVGFVICAALCLCGNSKPQPSAAGWSCEELSHQNLSEAAFTSNFELSSSVYLIVSWNIVVGSQPVAGQALQSGKSF